MRTFHSTRQEFHGFGQLWLLSRRREGWLRQLWNSIQRLQAGSASPNPCILCQHREDEISQGPLKELNMQFPKCLRSLQFSWAPFEESQPSFFPFFSPLVFHSASDNQSGPLAHCSLRHLPPRKAKERKGEKPHEDIKTSNWNVYRLVGEFIPDSHIPVYCWKQLFSYLWLF